MSMDAEQLKFYQRGYDEGRAAGLRSALEDARELARQKDSPSPDQPGAAGTRIRQPKFVAVFVPLPLDGKPVELVAPAGYPVCSGWQPGNYSVQAAFVVTNPSITVIWETQR